LAKKPKDFPEAYEGRTLLVKNLSDETRQEIFAEEARLLKAYEKIAPTNFMVFTRGLVIASQTGPRRFENCMAQFQRECFEEIAPSLEAVRLGICPEIQRFWIERTKKGSKDADLAVMMMWLVCFPVRPLYMQVGAADRSQAGIVRDRMSHLLEHNKWLNDHVEIIGNEIRSKLKMASGKPMALIDIRSSDVAGAHGGTPDVLIINELSHITKWEFAENLMSNAAGVSQGLVIIATNAGYRGTKAEVWRNNALASSDWGVHILARPAPWHSQRALRDEKQRETRSRYRRLWWGIWASGKGDAIDEDAINRAFSLTGPTVLPEDGWIYLQGIDLGISHDHAGTVVLGVNLNQQRMKVVFFKAWEPKLETGEVDLISVERDCVMVARIYNPLVVLYDPAQAVLMAQRMRLAGISMKEWPFTPKNWTLMATGFLQVFKENKVECYDDLEGRLRRDFGKFSIVEKSYGYRLEAVSDEFGHADVGTAFVICVPAALEYLNGNCDILQPGDEVASTDNTELTDAEIKAMPQELKDLYESEDDGRTGKSHADLFYAPARPKKARTKDPFADLS
jgi:hypothetical protein